MKTEEFTLSESEDAATFRENIKGWVSKSGRFSVDTESSERLARYDGCTHIRCECGELTEKTWTRCAECREKGRHERWLQKPVGEWDGEGIIFSEILNDYLDADEVADKEEEFGPLDLVICDPIKLGHIDDEHLADELCLEDGHADLPTHVADAVEALNIELDKMKPVTWCSGRYRVMSEEDSTPSISK